MNRYHDPKDKREFNNSGEAFEADIDDLYGDSEEEKEEKEEIAE